MSAQRARSVIGADHRSALPNVTGVPWWGAIVIAVTASTIGFAFDAGSGNKELTFVFSTLYVVGCLVAVLAVRQVSVFTAVVQPPLILFVVVPGAYWLFNGASFPGLKEIAINCGYPLIERFPLMLLSSALVLVVGIVRWYAGRVRHATADRSANTEDDAFEDEDIPGRLKGLAARFRRSDKAEYDEHDAERPRGQNVDRPRPSTTRSSHADRNDRSGHPEQRARRPAATRSRYARPPLVSDMPESVPERPRRTRRTEPTAAEYVDPDLRDARRRTRAPSGREPRDGREPRPVREPHEAGESRDVRVHREPGERRTETTGATDKREPRRRDHLPSLEREAGRGERHEAGDYETRPRRWRPRPEGYEPYEPPIVEPPSFDASSPPRKRPSSNGSSRTHHPFSNVRYRGADDGENHVEHRSRHSRDGDRWRDDA
ncbi:MAG: DUF6542 domain-containing protein [Mycobacterium sp.]